MKSLVGLVVILTVAGVGAVAAYDYTVGGVGLLPSSLKSDAEQPTPCCHLPQASCCTESAAEDSCPACPSCPSATAAACPYCTGDKAEAEAELIPAPKASTPVPSND